MRSPDRAKTPESPGVVGDWAVDQEARLIVVDETGHRLFVERDDGTFRTVGRRGDRPGEFHYPTAIALWGDEAYVADSWNHRIQVFDRRTWVATRCFGRRGRRVGEFFRPSALAVVVREASAPWFAVADTNNNRLSFHDPSGEPLFVAELGAGEFPVDVACIDDTIRIRDEDGNWKTLGS